MDDPDVLHVEGFRRVLANWWSAGWRCNQRLRISGRGWSMVLQLWAAVWDHFLWSHDWKFSFLDGSFENAWQYFGSAWCGKRYNGLDPYRFGFGAIQCLSDRCGPLRSILERWWLVSTLHWLCGEVFHNWLCNDGTHHIERGYERMVPSLWAIWVSLWFLHALLWWLFLQLCGHEMNSFVNLLWRWCFALTGACDIEISTVFGYFHLHYGIQLILELTKPMFDETFEVCGNFSMRMPKFRFFEFEYSLQSRDCFWTLSNLLAPKTEETCQGEQDTRTTVKTLWFVWLVKRKLSVLWTFRFPSKDLTCLDLLGLTAFCERCVVLEGFGRFLCA